MITEKNSIGSPFVIISMNPIEDPFSTLQEDDILLKTQDGTLISFREAYADKDKDTSIIIELFDPDHLFVQRFFDENIVKSFSRFAKSPGREKDFEKARAEIDALVNPPKLTGTVAQSIILGYVLPTGEALTDNEVFDKKQDIINSLGDGFSQSNSVYITYGLGDSPSNVSPSRAFVLKGFEFIQESEKQGGIRLRFSHNVKKNNDELIGTLPISSKIGVVEYVEGPDLLHLSKKGIASVAIAHTPVNQYGSYTSYDDTNYIVPLMEYFLQKFLLESYNDQRDYPFIFLSPEVGDKLKTKMDQADEEQNNLVRVADWMGVRGKSKFRVLQDWLKKVGFVVNILTSSEGGDLGPGIAPDTDKVVYRLGIMRDEGKDPLTQVMEIIERIYETLGITRGSDILSRNVLEPSHVTHFTKNFLEGGKDLYKTKEVPEGYDNFTYQPNADITVDAAPGAPGPATSQTVSVPTTLLFIGDSYFIEGVLFKLPYEDNDLIHRGIMETSEKSKGSNIDKFHEKVNYKNYVKMLTDIYVDPVRKEGGSDLPDEFSIKLPSQAENIIRHWRQKIPTFLANMQHSNVISFVATHKNLEFKEIKSNISNIFKDNYPKAFIDADGNVVFPNTTPDITDAEVEALISAMVSAEYEKNGSLDALMRHLKPTYDPDNTHVKGAYETLVKSLVNNLRKSNALENNKISYSGLFTYLLFMQRLAMGQSFNKVKTLPMFNIIPEFWIRKPCLFLNKKLYSPQSLFNLNLKGTLSGIYTLIGFEHVITGSDCYSSFTTFRKSFLTEELEESPKAP